MAYDPLKDGILTRTMLVGRDGSGNYVEVPVTSGGSLTVSLTGAVFATNDVPFITSALVVRTIPSQLWDQPVVVTNDRFELLSTQAIGLVAPTYANLVGGIGDGLMVGASVTPGGELRVSSGGLSTYRYFGATGLQAAASVAGLQAVTIRADVGPSTTVTQVRSITARFSTEGWVELRKNATFSVAPTWAAVDTNSAVDSGGNTGTWTAGTGTPVFVCAGATNSSQTFDLTPYNIRLAPGDTLTAIVHSEAATISARIALNWHEEW